MAQTTTLYRWALLDKTGKNRGMCTAEDMRGANNEFRKQRGGRIVPEGWKLVSRGPVTPADRHKAQANKDQTMPKNNPMGLQIGDRVERINRSNGSMIPVGSIGTITGSGREYFIVKWDHCEVQENQNEPRNLIKINEPKTEEPSKAMRCALQRITDLEKERDKLQADWSQASERARKAELAYSAEVSANASVVQRMRDMESMRDKLREILDVPIGTSLVTAAQDIKAKLDETRGFLDAASMERDALSDHLEKINAVLIVDELGYLDPSTNAGEVLRITLGINSVTPRK